MEKARRGLPPLQEGKALSLKDIKDRGRKLVLYKDGHRVATLAYFKGQLSVQFGKQLLALNPGHHELPLPVDLDIDVTQNQIGFRVRGQNTFTFDTDYFSERDDKSWADLQKPVPVELSAKRTNYGVRVAALLGLAAAAAGAAVAFEGCPAEAEDQYEASGE